jgi:hypothetical protein
MRIEVRSKVPGAAGDRLPDVLVELTTDRTTARELIRRTVEEQVRLLWVDKTHYQSALDRQYLSNEDIKAQAANGVIRLPAPPTSIDVEAEVARALQAFERGVFVIFVGGRQVDRPDDEIVLRLGEPVPNDDSTMWSRPSATSHHRCRPARSMSRAALPHPGRKGIFRLRRRSGRRRGNRSLPA